MGLFNRNRDHNADQSPATTAVGSKANSMDGHPNGAADAFNSNPEKHTRTNANMHVPSITARTIFMTALVAMGYV
jgi:hypothetical protein